MSIEKKSLISTLKSAKKANVAKDETFDHSGSAVKTQPSVKLNQKKLNQKKLSQKKLNQKKLVVKDI